MLSKHVHVFYMSRIGFPELYPKAHLEDSQISGHFVAMTGPQIYNKEKKWSNAPQWEDFYSFLKLP